MFKSLHSHEHLLV